MSNGAVMDYKFGKKNQWRRTIWNHIARQLEVPPRDAVVLYLAGAQDLDRTEALRRGFRWDNLLAVDRESKIVKSLRSDGKLVIHGDIADVIKNWHGIPVSVVFADLCGILNPKLIEELVTRPDFKYSVIALNFLAGRDGKLSKYLTGQHRGQSAFGLAMHFLADAYSNMFRIGKEKILEDWIDVFSEWTSFESYTSSSGQRFDSCVYRNPSLIKLSVALHRIAGLVGSIPTVSAKSELLRIGSITGNYDPEESISRQILAIRATRTRYINSAQ